MGDDGSLSVEAVILFPLLALVVVAVVEFGYLWFVRHTLTTASREGARAAVVYYPAPNRSTWAENTARDTVNRYLQDTKFPGTWEVTVEPVGSSSGEPLTVTVKSNQGLVLLPKLIPAFKNLTVSAQTTMIME